MKNMITSAAAMMAALEYAGLNIGETYDRHIVVRDGLFEISFRTLFMVYEIYVDAFSGELPGFNCEPALPASSYEPAGIAA